MTQPTASTAGTGTTRTAPTMPPYVTMFPLIGELRGERVLLRPWREADAEALYAAVVANREHLARFLPWAHLHTSIDYTRDLIYHWQANRLLREGEFGFGIWQPESGELLGAIGLHIRSWPARAFEIGYWLSASAEGHGYMSEAVRLLTDAAFATYGANRVEIRCDARNERSAGVARRLGFRQEGYLHSPILGADGTLRDTLIFALTPDDPRWES